MTTDIGIQMAEDQVASNFIVYAAWNHVIARQES